MSQRSQPNFFGNVGDDCNAMDGISCGALRESAWIYRCTVNRVEARFSIVLGCVVCDVRARYRVDAELFARYDGAVQDYTSTHSWNVHATATSAAYQMQHTPGDVVLVCLCCACVGADARTSVHPAPPSRRTTVPKV